MRSSAPNGPVGFSRRAVALTAVFSGVTVANLYVAHPILPLIGSSFGVTGDRAGLVVTVGQVGYTAGLFFVVPLGDVFRRRGLLAVLLATATSAAIVASTVPSLLALAMATAVLCVAAVGAHVLIPLLVGATSPERRGHALVLNNSAIIAGIALSRVVYGAVGDAFGWRVVYLVAGGMTAVFGTAVMISLPREVARPSTSYRALIVSTARLVAEESTVRWAAAIQMPVFAAYNFVWVTLALLLTGPHYRLSVGTAGLFGLCAAITLASGPFVGRLLDRAGSRRTMALGCATLISGAMVMLFSTRSLVIVVAGLLLLIVGQQQVATANQTRVLAIRESARSRLNSIYVTGNFLGGTTASLLAVVLYGRWGWEGITIATLIATLIASTNLILETRRS